MNSFDRHIHTQAELEAAWRDLVTPLGWSSPRFWIMLIEPSGSPLPQLIEIDELEGAPRDDDIERGAQFGWPSSTRAPAARASSRSTGAGRCR